MKQFEVRIFGKTYLVRPLAKPSVHLQDIAGANYPKHGIIEYDSEQKADQLQDTLLHEMIHVLDYDMQLELSERQVHCLASGIICLMKDNPTLIERLFK